MKSVWPLIILIFLALPAPARAQERMSFPLGCSPGRTCWIASYPDLNGAEGAAQDYACGPSAQDGDVFLRIVLADVAAVPLSVPVLAAADGTVIDASDGVPDRVIASRAQLPSGTLNCGNGIVIRHAPGVESAYCHLRQGSLKVAKGQSVRKGDIIAAAGQSGLATWPQLGFAVRKGGYFVDPMSGATTAEGCGMAARPLLEVTPPFTDYQPAAIVALGFANRAVPADEMVLGKAPLFAQVDRQERTINLWAMVLGVHRGDEIETRIRDPRGRTFVHQKVTAGADAARLPLNLPRDRGYVGWRTGLYTGDITITRMVQHRPVKVSRQVTLMVE